MPEGQLGTEKDIVGHRIVAVILDTIFVPIISIIFVMLLLLISFVLGVIGAAIDVPIITDILRLFSGLSTFSAIIVLFSIPVIFVVYPFVFEGWRGQTIGKMVMSIVVVKEAGGKCGWGASILRNLFRYIDGLFFYLVGFISMAATEKRQRVGDRLANTVVVKVKK